MHKVKLFRSFGIAGALLAGACTAVAQDSSYPRVEVAPQFMFQHNSPVLGGSQSFNCAGGGATFAYNITGVLGLTADLGACHTFGLDNTYGVGSKVNGNEGTYVFGPRITFRTGTLRPFVEINVGVEQVAFFCNTGNVGGPCGALSATQLPAPTATSISRNAFALTAGGGLDLKVNKSFAIRLVQAEYLYTRFSNDCQFAVCSNNNSQNSFRLESGVVFGWGGAQ
jgi:opacity protein-like surface antigen